MTEYEEFAQWMDIILTPELPKGVAAFNFNLYEDAEDGHLFAVQLIGAPSYDPNLPDWACEELFSTGEYLFLLRSISWETCLDTCADYAGRYLETGHYRRKLLSAKAVTAGFVDGDLVVVREQQ